MRWRRRRRRRRRCGHGIGTKWEPHVLKWCTMTRRYAKWDEATAFRQPRRFPTHICILCGQKLSGIMLAHLYGNVHKTIRYQYTTYTEIPISFFSSQRLASPRLALPRFLWKCLFELHGRMLHIAFWLEMSAAHPYILVAGGQIDEQRENQMHFVWLYFTGSRLLVRTNLSFLFEERAATNINPSRDKDEEEDD